MTTPSKRVKAILDELEAAASAYTSTKDTFERARVQFEAARYRFGGVRELATQMMTVEDLEAWRIDHPYQRYAALPLGEAIVLALRDHAVRAAYRAIGGADYFPGLPLGEIVEFMELGGFDFRSTAPLREVNAALMNLKGVEKSGDDSYSVQNPWEILRAIEKSEREKE